METIETHTIVRPKSSYWESWLGRGSELFACTVFNLAIFFCIALCFLQSRSHKLFKTPNILKIRFEITFLHRFSEKIFFENFWKTENCENFSKIFHEKSKMSKFLKNQFFRFSDKFSTFSIYREKFSKNFHNFQFFKKFKKIFFLKIDVKM